MDSLSVFTHEMLVKSDLIRWSFDARSGDFSAELTSQMVGWLAEKYLLGGCASLASAIAYEVGRERLVSFQWGDGRLCHAVVACSDQHDEELRGYGVDILGRRPLKLMRQEIAALADVKRVSIGWMIERSEFDDDEQQALVDLAASLPWLATVLRRPQVVDVAATLAAMQRLGYSA
ncbi:hypothetical protein [Mesorhizobium sp. SP-1A]|uniref:hypothetical protein n=1 Tax=Mesorhizobium sp. SP-1A TaxID=3077840 RepID=UPI0028F7107D|nr:hypothetical protein [Mesorhizobium sp. SP-1A]